MKKATNDWLISAESDLLLIQKILDEESLTHLAAFHAQQSIEKAFKAVIEEYDLGFVKIHILETLYHKVNDKILLKIDSDLLSLLDQLYIDARYPGEFGLLPFGKPMKDDIMNFYNLAKEILEAVKSACK
jgi:HEPN domain-containing protein